MTVRHVLEIHDRDGQLWAHVQPVADSAALAEAEVRARIEDAGYGHWHLKDEAIAMLVGRFNASPSPLEMQVGERQDAQLTLEVAPDASCVWAQVTPARGGQPLTPDDLAQALQQAQVVFGVDPGALQQACAAQTPARLLLASAQPPVHGTDARFQLLVDLARDRAPQVDARGLIDFREHGAIPTVDVGTPVMRRIPAQAGVDGRNVRGEPLPATPGLDHPYAANLAGVTPSQEDANVLVATLKGCPASVEHGVLVEQLLSVGSVDMNLGNITYDGSVHIEGDVLAGMKVHVSGDITVTGTVEGGELEAGGFIAVGGGILAHAQVQAAGAVSARFVENSRVHAGTVIAIEDMALQSELQALNQILVGEKAPERGRLVGGTARSMMQIRTPWLGADASGITTVQVGVNPELEARHQALEALIRKQDAELDNLSKVVTHLKQQGDPKGLLERARASWRHATQELARYVQEKTELQERLALSKEARVEVTQGVAGSVDLMFGKHVRHLQRSYDAGVFSLDEAGQLVLRQGHGEPTVVH